VQSGIAGCLCLHKSFADATLALKQSTHNQKTMKKLLLGMGAVTLLFSACKKSDDDSGTGGSRKSTLTSGKWRITASTATIEYPAPAGTQTMDALKLFPSCQIDNLIGYNSDGTMTIDEGATKCNSSDPQVKTGGSWALLDNDSKLRLTDNGTTVTASITAFSSSSMTVSVDTTVAGMKATTVTTYTHQ
jgi:hypothetical protein